MELDNGVDILLIEDSVSDAEMTIRALKKHSLSHNLVHLKDGALALEFLFATGMYTGRNTNNKPKVVLLDLKMPKVNGMQVLERIKNDPATKDIPVVILTSSKENPDVEKCYKMGVNSYVVKPVEFTSFMKAISELGMYWMGLNQSPY